MKDMGYVKEKAAQAAIFFGEMVVFATFVAVIGGVTLVLEALVNG